MGLDAEMIATSDPEEIGGWIAYVDGAARSLPRAKPFRAVYQVDEGRLHSHRAYSLLFANCGTLPAAFP